MSFWGVKSPVAIIDVDVPDFTNPTTIDLVDIDGIEVGDVLLQIAYDFERSSGDQDIFFALEDDSSSGTKRSIGIWNGTGLDNFVPTAISPSSLDDSEDDLSLQVATQDFKSHGVVITENMKFTATVVTGAGTVNLTITFYIARVM